jgi:hypothetical protein
MLAFFFTAIETINDAPSFTLNTTLMMLNVTEDACNGQLPCTIKHFVTHAQPGGNLLNQYASFDWNETSQRLSFVVWHHVEGGNGEGNGGGRGTSKYFSIQPHVDADLLDLSFAMASEFSGMLDMRILVKVCLHAHTFGDDRYKSEWQRIKMQNAFALTLARSWSHTMMLSTFS